MVEIFLGYTTGEMHVKLRVQRHRLAKRLRSHDKISGHQYNKKHSS